MSIRNDALAELSDILSQNLHLAGDRLDWIWNYCNTDSPSLPHDPAYRSSLQLEGALAIARFLSKCQDMQNHKDFLSILVHFVQSLPSLSKDVSFPKLTEVDAAGSYFLELTKCLAKIVEASCADASSLSDAIASVIQKMVTGTAAGEPCSPALSSFLWALARNCPPLDAKNAELVCSCFLEHWILPGQASIPVSSSSETSAQSSPLVHSQAHLTNSTRSPCLEYVQSPRRSSLEQQNARSKGRSGIMAMKDSPTTRFKVKEEQCQITTFEQRGASSLSKTNGSLNGRNTLEQVVQQGRRPFEDTFDFGQYLVALEDETLELLERYEISFRLLACLLERAGSKFWWKDSVMQQLKHVVSSQLRALPPFLRLRKQHWRLDGLLLKAKVNLKLRVSQAAAMVYVSCFLHFKEEGKASKSFIRETLALLLDSAEASLASPLRRLKACEELFCSLVTGVSQVAVSCGSHTLRVLLLRLKTLITVTCAQVDTWANNRGLVFECVLNMSWKVVNAGWNLDRGAVESFLLALASNVREDHVQEEQQQLAAAHLNVIRLLGDLAILINKAEVVEMILPLFIERLEDGDASIPSLLRLRLLDAVAHMSSLGYEKSYREAVILLTRSYLDKLTTVGSTQSRTLAPEATTERVETLPGAFLTIACGLKQSKLRADYRQRLLLLCSDVGLAVESKSAKSGADFLGPLLPSVAEICSDFDPLQDIEPSLFKLFRNLWFYIVLFGLAPPIQKANTSLKSASVNFPNSGSMSAMSLQAVTGPYMWNTHWSTAVQRITEGTPPLIVGSVKWLEDELELNALHRPGSRRGSNNEKAASAQRSALSAALGGRVEAASMGTISGVKATYLLAVAFLEILRLHHKGGILRSSSEEKRCSALSCSFKYLETQNLLPAVYLCLGAIIHRAFDAVLAWLEERMPVIGDEAKERESIVITHACFLIKHLTHREENVREISVNLLIQLKVKHPQVLWNKSCLDSLLQLVGIFSSPMIGDPIGVPAMRVFLQRQVQSWVGQALLFAPCTTHGVLQELFQKLNTWPSASYTTDLLAFLTDIQLDLRKNEPWSAFQNINIPAVVCAAAVAAGASPQIVETGNLHVLSSGIVSANVKSSYIYVSIGGLTLGQGPLVNMTRQNRIPAGGENRNSNSMTPSEDSSLNEILILRFLLLIQQFVTTAEKGAVIDAKDFREACLRATALLLSDTCLSEKGITEGLSQLLRLLCWCPAYIFTSEAMEIGVFVWVWLVSAAPHLESLLLAEIVDAWLWTIDTGSGLFASGISNSGPAVKLMPHLVPGESIAIEAKDVVEGVAVHQLWLGFLLDRFEVVRHRSLEQLFLIGRILQASLRTADHFSCHPVAASSFFTLMLFGLKFCACQLQTVLHVRMGIYLLEDRIYRATFYWFEVDPGWYDSNVEISVKALNLFIQQLALDQTESSMLGETVTKLPIHDVEGALSNSAGLQLDSAHPVWGRMDNYLIGREKRKQLLLLLCQQEAERLDTWANPLKDNPSARLRLSSERWIDYARTAWSIDPRIALGLVSRFPSVAALRSEVTVLVHRHLSELYHIPEALPFFVTPKATEENSTVLQHLPHWAPCSITRALGFLIPAYKSHPRIIAYVLRVLESYPPERVTFFMPQLVQALRYDDEGLMEGYLMTAAKRSHIFAHILIWQLQGEEPPTLDDAGKEACKGNPFHEMVIKVKLRIIESFTPDAYDMFVREFRFFDKVTNISGKLFPLQKEERKAEIRRQLEKIEVEGDDLYLPTAPIKIVKGIRIDSGVPLQSAAKVPIMVTFNVMDRGGDPKNIHTQACIFKVGDDCRQDVLALQVITLLRDIFEAVNLNLYLFPYGVLPTGCGRGIIEVVPNTRSRNQMGETTDGGLYEIFQQEYGPVGSPRFEAARDNFIISSAGYAVASLLLQPKDRHNGNLLFDNQGRLVHIDFGFILETSPGGNLRFENAQFKLSHEMTQLLDPSGVMKSDTWNRFVILCVKGYLAARQHMDGIINTVLLMVDSGLPCFSRGDPIGNLRKRFHPEMSEREAANFMIKACADAYNKWTTTGYDLIQYLQQGIEM